VVVQGGHGHPEPALIRRPLLSLQPVTYVKAVTITRRLYALGPDGSLRWSYKAATAIQSLPSVDARGGLVAVGTSGREVLGLDAQTGRRMWSFATDG
jgi:outer membrane protein assembly factor BamB